MLVDPTALLAHLDAIGVSSRGADACAGFAGGTVARWRRGYAAQDALVDRLCVAVGRPELVHECVPIPCRRGHERDVVSNGVGHQVCRECRNDWQRRRCAA